MLAMITEEEEAKKEGTAIELSSSVVVGAVGVGVVVVIVETMEGLLNFLTVLPASGCIGLIIRIRDRKRVMGFNMRMGMTTIIPLHMKWVRMITRTEGEIQT